MNKIIFISVFSACLYAEALDIKDNKYTGKTFQLALTEKQVMNVRDGYKAYMALHLTEREMSVIKNSAKVKIPPTIIHIYKIEDIKNECTCCMANVAIYYGGNKIAILPEYIMSDLEAKKSMPEE